MFVLNGLKPKFHYTDFPVTSATRPRQARDISVDLSATSPTSPCLVADVADFLSVTRHGEVGKSRTSPFLPVTSHRLSTSDIYKYFFSKFTLSSAFRLILANKIKYGLWRGGSCYVIFSSGLFSAMLRITVNPSAGNGFLRRLPATGGGGGGGVK